MNNKPVLFIKNKTSTKYCVKGKLNPIIVNTK